MSASEFFEKMAPYAQKAGTSLDIFPSTILAQWAIESGYGSSNLAQNANNYGGIKYVAGKSIASGQEGDFASYSSITQFINDYVRVMKLSYYDAVRAGQTPQEEIQALVGSKYDEGKYSGGKTLLDILTKNNLSQYDAGAVVASPGNALGLPSGNVNYLAWFLIGVGVLVMIKSLGGDAAQVRESALEVVSRAEM